MIAIVGYGLGNVRAFFNIYKNRNIAATIAYSADELEGASKIILPGVGAFDWAMDRLEQSGMKEKLNELVMVRKVPVLGVCVGMQMMARNSEEGERDGLGWLDAQVVRLKDDAHLSARLPHMGWNTVQPVSGNSRLFEGLQDLPEFYFLHSYVIEPKNEAVTSATTVHGESFVCAVESDNVYGTQFHPEKSHSNGEKLLLNFAER